MRHSALLLGLVVGLTACSGGSPTSPTSPGSPIAPATQGQTASATSVPNSPSAPTVPAAVVPPVPVTSWSSSSPDGQWTAQGTAQLPAKMGDGVYWIQLKVTSRNGQTYMPVNEKPPYQPGYTTPQPLVWSQDGSSLYYTDLPHPDGCAAFENGQDLRRVDLTTGKVTEVLPKVATALAISPDERMLAYIPDGKPANLVLRFMSTGTEESVTLPTKDSDIQSGSIAWAPYSTSLVLTMAAHPCDPAHWMHSIYRVDVASVAAKVLMQNNPGYVRTVGWTSPQSIQVDEGQGNFVILDASTGNPAK